MASAAEARRDSRRTLGVLKQLGVVLDVMAANVNDTHRDVRTLSAGSGPAANGGLPGEWALALVEMADRMNRIADSLARPPAANACWWPGARRSLAAWQQAWNLQVEAFGILRGHQRALLERAGFSRMKTVGRPFDPATMTAVESVPDASQPDHTVVAELLPGWRHHSGQILRPAQVRVSRHPSSQPTES